MREEVIDETNLQTESQQSRDDGKRFEGSKSTEKTCVSTSALTISSEQRELIRVTGQE